MTTAKQAIQSAIRELGPWTPEDSPEDVLYDILRDDPEAEGLVTLGDVKEYLGSLEDTDGERWDGLS